MSDTSATRTTPASSGTGTATASPTITVALTPGSLNVDQVLDLNSKIGINVYNKAIEPVKIPFDGNSKNINLFQSQLSRKAAIAGWDVGTGDILTIADAQGDQKNLLTEYGYLTEKDIRTSLV